MSKRHLSKFPENNSFVNYENTPFEILQIVISFKKNFFLLYCSLTAFRGSLPISENTLLGVERVLKNVNLIQNTSTVTIIV